jgi:hypothetical protein
MSDANLHFHSTLSGLRGNDITMRPAHGMLLLLKVSTVAISGQKLQLHIIETNIIDQIHNQANVKLSLLEQTWH